MFHTHICIFLLHTGYVCYDDGCHLHKYTYNPCRAHLTSTATNMTKLCIVIDKMHMKGHIDPWCKRTCDPKFFPQLNNVSQARNPLNIS